MSTIQLCDIGVENEKLNITKKFVTNYFIEDFSNNILRMAIECDVKVPEYLVIKLNPNIPIKYFKDICHEVCLEMYMSKERILNIPLRFMMHLKEYDICDGDFYISIPFQMFCDDIKLISTNEVMFHLTNTDDNFVSCKLISKGIYYTSSIRHQIAEGGQEEIIKCLASTELTSCVQRDEFIYRMPFGGIHNGFFIETENVDEINKLMLILNNNCRTNYNRFLVKKKCIKINQHLLYFPLNYDKSYTDRTNEGLQSSLNLSRIDSAFLIIKLDQPNTKICIYGLGVNLLKYGKSEHKPLDPLWRYKPTDTSLEYKNYFSNHEYKEYGKNIITPSILGGITI